MMETPPEIIQPGFSDYVIDSQKVFRLALDCLSRPCRPLEFDRSLISPQAPLSPVAGALALTLLDAATPVWLSPSWQKAADWLRFHRGCPVVQEPEKASFVLAATQAELPPLASLNQGSDRYPDSSATIILASVLPLDGQDPLTAEGPGIDGRLCFVGHGLSQNFLAQWLDNRESYPLGVDVFLAGATHLAGLPRSTRLAGRKGAPSCM